MSGESAPPAAELLERLPREDWLILLTYIRAALHALDEDLVTPRMAQLRAAPSAKLATGRSRRDLCRLLAEGGALWRTTIERIAEDREAARRFSWLLHGEQPPSHEPPRPPRQPAQDRDARARARARELVKQRDAARRRATGLEARLEVERERSAALLAELEKMISERDELVRTLQGAAAEREQAIERATRHSETQLAALREELRVLRRAHEERRQRRQRAAARRSARHSEVERDKLDRARHPRRVATPGRPSRLPQGVTPGTAEAATALLNAVRCVLVDGYNVTKQHRGHLPLEQQRLWLVRLLEGFAARSGIRCRVVFDGDPLASPPAMSSRRVAVTFTTGGSADDELVAIVAALPAHEPVVVVTDDRELAARLAEYEVDVLGTSVFVDVVE